MIHINTQLKFIKAFILNVTLVARKQFLETLKFRHIIKALAQTIRKCSIKHDLFIKRKFYKKQTYKTGRYIIKCYLYLSNYKTIYTDIDIDDMFKIIILHSNNR